MRVSLSLSLFGLRADVFYFFKKQFDSHFYLSWSPCTPSLEFLKPLPHFPEKEVAIRNLRIRERTVRTVASIFCILNELCNIARAVKLCRSLPNTIPKLVSLDGSRRTSHRSHRTLGLVAEVWPIEAERSLVLSISLSSALSSRHGRPMGVKMVDSRTIKRRETFPDHDHPVAPRRGPADLRWKSIDICWGAGERRARTPTSRGE